MILFPSRKKKLRRLYELYSQKMYAVAYQILKDNYLAEDAVHNAFLKMSSNLDKIGEPEEKASGNYLFIITRNEAFRLYHQNQKQIPAEIPEDQIPDLQNIELETEHKELQKKVYEIICSLDPIYCDVLLLKFYYELTDSEIAQTLEISVDNARVRLHRAKQKLKVRLSEVYGNE